MNNIKKEDKLKNFGVVMTLAFLVLCLLTTYTKNNFGVLQFSFLILAALFLFSAFLYSKILAPLEKLWMIIGEKIGHIVTFLVLVISYYTVFTFVSLLLKILGKDILQLKLNRAGKSYWSDIKREESRETTRPFLPY